MKNSIHTILSKFRGLAGKAFGLIIAIAMVFATTTADANAEMLTDTNYDGTAFVADTTVYDVVDVMPEIKGGLNKVYEYVEYPRLATRSGIEGRVFVKFVVNEQGKVEDPKVLKDIGGGCGDAAVEGIKKLEFTPGKKDGQVVKVYYTLPVNFKLQ